MQDQPCPYCSSKPYAGLQWKRSHGHFPHKHLRDSAHNLSAFAIDACLHDCNPLHVLVDRGRRRRRLYSEILTWKSLLQLTRKKNHPHSKTTHGALDLTSTFAMQIVHGPNPLHKLASVLLMAYPAPRPHRGPFVHHFTWSNDKFHNNPIRRKNTHQTVYENLISMGLQNACTTQLQQTHHTQCQEGNSGSIGSNKNPCAANQLPMMCDHRFKCQLVT